MIGASVFDVPHPSLQNLRTTHVCMHRCLHSSFDKKTEKHEQAETYFVAYLSTDYTLENPPYFAPPWRTGARLSFHLENASPSGHNAIFIFARDLHKRDPISTAAIIRFTRAKDTRIQRAIVVYFTYPSMCTVIVNVSSEMHLKTVQYKGRATVQVRDRFLRAL